MINISDLWFTQHVLNRADQIPDMVKEIEEGVLLPPIEIRRCPDAELEIINGHHSVVAMYLSGRECLESGEYILWDSDDYCTRCGKIDRYL